MLRIKRDDLVVAIAGKDKGKRGKVLKILSKENKAIVERINMTKKNLRRTREDQQTGVIEKESPIHLSNLMLYCKRCNSPVRFGVTTLKDGTKSRICRRCNEVI